MHLRQVGEVGDVAIGRMRTELAVGLGPREQFAEHVGVHVGASALGQDAVLVAVALEDRLDDQFRGLRAIDRSKARSAAATTASIS